MVHRFAEELQNAEERARRAEQQAREANMRAQQQQQEGSQHHAAGYNDGYDQRNGYQDQQLREQQEVIERLRHDLIMMANEMRDRNFKIADIVRRLRDEY